MVHDGSYKSELGLQTYKTVKLSIFTSFGSLEAQPHIHHILCNFLQGIQLKCRKMTLFCGQIDDMIS